MVKVASLQTEENITLSLKTRPVLKFPLSFVLLVVDYFSGHLISCFFDGDSSQPDCSLHILLFLQPNLHYKT